MTITWDLCGWSEIISLCQPEVGLLSNPEGFRYSLEMKDKGRFLSDSQLLMVSIIKVWRCLAF